jgi:formylglycine-generating enzyme required for sulfatase activity
VGNVWEWTCSEYEDKYSGKEKQCIDKEDAKNINLSLRGGGWGGKPIGVRSAVRFKWRQSDRNIDLGLRLVRQ